MTVKKFRFIYNSLFFKVILVIFIILLPLVSLLIYNNYQARISLIKQVEATHKNMLQSYVAQIDSQLKISMVSALDMAVTQNDPKNLLANTDDEEIAILKYNIYNNLTDKLLSIYMVDTLFVYVKKGDYFISASQYKTNQIETPELRNLVVAYSKGIKYSDNSPKSSWQFTNIDNTNSLVNFSYVDQDIIAGVYINTDRIIKNYFHTDTPSSQLRFIPTSSKTDETLKFDADTKLISIDSKVANITMVENLTKADILRSLPFMQKYVLLASTIFILTGPILILLMNIIVIIPLNRLTYAMTSVQSGDLSYRAPKKQSSNEFETVNLIFNEMMDTVQKLKINVYEEQIKFQKSQLRNLQLQIKPHFLINSLNMVNDLIYDQELDAASRLILLSVDYFRYMAKADRNFVPLNDEITHLTNYLEIQKIRYINRFTYSIQVNKLIADMVIPPMLIQNFVENSVKYAIQTDNIIHISVNVEYFEIDYYPYAKITILDTGIGYPPEMLEQLNSGKKLNNLPGNHIGIFNSVQRIKILYEGKASWKFYNNYGAISELVLPALFETNGDLHQL
jgi:two-component system, sensor histidine kinase YesM